MEHRQSNQHAFSLNQQTPLHLAAREGHMDTVEFLINNEADINIQDNDGVSRLNDLYACTSTLVFSIR